MRKRIIEYLTIVFVVVSVLFLIIGLYCIGQVTTSQHMESSTKLLVFVLLTFCISYGALSFIIIALILRQVYKLMEKSKNKKRTLK